MKHMNPTKFEQWMTWKFVITQKKDTIEILKYKNCNRNLLIFWFSRTIKHYVFISLLIFNLYLWQ